MYSRISEKESYHGPGARQDGGYRWIVLFQHLLLWASLYVVGSTLFATISTSATSETVLVPAVITAATGLISVIYVALHNASVLLSKYRPREQRSNEGSKMRWLSMAILRLIMILWLISNGLDLTFTLARHPRCSGLTNGRITSIAAGTPCVVQRSSIGASLLALFSCLALFVVIHRAEEPFRAHLFGVMEEPALLPLMLPYRASHERPMFSEMSFKCRSSTSLSSHTLVPSFDSTTTLLPKRPDKVVGLGIYAPKTSATFLGPRPSLSSIRTHTTIGTIPPSSPLPPLPTHFPSRYRKGSAMHAAVYPPKRPSRPERSKSDRTVRIVPPSPALSITNLKLHNSSMESLSSIYSRSISGESHYSERMRRPQHLTEGTRSYSSGSTAIVVKSPLGAMRLAEQPDIVVMNKHSRRSSGSSTTEIDDVVTLQAKLPSVKAISDFGDVQAWKFQDAIQGIRTGDGAPYNEDSKQRTWMPLRVQRTRDSESLFEYKNVNPLA